MKIETKYEIGDRIWIIYESRGEVCVYDDYISYITYDNGLSYITKQSYEEVNEDDIILYNDTEKLLKRIEKLMQEIHEKEKA